MRPSIDPRRLVLVAAVLLAVLVPGAGAAGGSVDRLLAPPGRCAGDRLRGAGAEQVQAMACLVDYARARAGLPSLRLRAALAGAALLKVDADLRCGQFSHTPCGMPFLSVFSRAGYLRGAEGYAVGENLAWATGTRTSPRQIMRLWLHSPPHLENLLSPRWRDFGLGVRARVPFLGARNATVWASEFGARGA
jgi:uncharacterized protein YkwD